MFFGRKHELDLLNQKYDSTKSELIVIYGRRRIGKSSLIGEFSKKKPAYCHFEAIEGQRMPRQIAHFKQQLQEQTSDSFLKNMLFSSWEQVFQYLTEKVVNAPTRGGKLVLFLDEIQWMASGRASLISLIKYYWDTRWKDKNVMLILCGSIASFMVKKVIASKALYGRITLELLLQGLAPEEAKKFFQGKRDQEEILRYLLVFGSVPKYLEEIDLNKSFNQNINRLCFTPQGGMVQEMDRIFYSQFRETAVYRHIVETLQAGLFSAVELGRKIKISSGGGLMSYLKNLETSEFIRSFVPFDRSSNTKFRKYRLFDEYLCFYFKFMSPCIRTIHESNSQKKFETLCAPGFQSWLGFAFERFCLKQSDKIARILGFQDEVLTVSPYFERGDSGFQIDLLYRRADRVVTVCEIKHSKDPIGTKVIPEVERKCGLLKLPRGHTIERVLISLYGPDRSLKESGFFHHHVTMEELFS
ncbi:MAG: hypothetical protein A2268_00565 [Candidatus Raymondbacteria bacterium RifOxyA12_full_50_37]|uniref:ATPase domain-containing protein n=1 Tax=Candidatus Raymondbacteria bacterium RIFOXYD12_FULL_49_13 TaxID=1817890 RepID=A0A1F7F3C9_UNCRA|nr:MAG: hypothetical protein A2268_00565 [Candidatus Raymondbacteria bacterium RifOxyA12_full_50_37]OGJ92806.1 MAG: hypothetical protein A2248_04615 [Candidatus Raymondbacteria bacterium RIFOXYA2_FULL_49_16]OGK01006.1 MAG: hypothetical protein A2519_17280 [Candidatus Raymondbacteria bacterium RIFOXYD12_FULL_49_13]OGK03554.1 MAG: hypothetical protein A2487_06730 [Candidatus Raymondbacteria bacterium RifOxyC12_full_50_8]OGP44582.1 MAG: hypothetical protein A2324_10410 [Candidatus Raymondbacteria 